MRWSLLLAVFGLSITDVASFAQRPPDGQRLSSTRSSPQDAGFFAVTGVVRFQLVQGRLSLDPPRHRKGSQNRDEGGVYESITVTAERGIPSVQYVFQTEQHQINLSVQNATEVRIESWFPKLSERSILEQPDFGEITWTHTRGDLADHHQGATILHVRHEAESDFDNHFGQLVQRLLRGQLLADLSQATHVAMLQQAARGGTPSEPRIREQVEQLRSNRRFDRVIAERQLLSWGTPVIPVLRRLLMEDLDAEQRDRVRGVLAQLRPRVSDTPASLAKLLVNDASYWNRIVAHLDTGQLQLANQHLAVFGAPQILQSRQPQARVATKPVHSIRR